MSRGEKTDILRKHYFVVLAKVCRQAKFAYGGLILSSSQFMPLPQQPLKMTFAIKAVKIKTKIIILLP
jgi:hypothetical protein